MAASDYDFINTRNDILVSAYRKIGVLEDGESLSGNQVTEGATELNTVVSSWEADGYKLFQLANDTLTTVDGTNEYAAPTDPPILGLFHASYDSTGYDVLVSIYSIGDFQDLTEKTASGAPLIICFEPHNSQFRIYPTPDDVYTITLIEISKIKDFDLASSTSNITRPWQRALIWHVALELSFNYGLPIAERQMIEKQANTWLKKAKKGTGNTETTDTQRVKGYY